jgi:hypothetical protein
MLDSASVGRGQLADLGVDLVVELASEVLPDLGAAKVGDHRAASYSSMGHKMW